MDLDKELQALEILNSIPLPPDPAPVPSVYDGSGLVEMPIVLVDYFKKINVDPGLDEDGRMPVSQYLDLLKKYHINSGSTKIISFKVVTRENYKDKK